MSTDIPGHKSDDVQLQTFEQKVNAVASSMTQGDDGNWIIPEDVEATEEVKYAATLEKRRRDTQAAYGKSQQERKRLETENAQLEAAWAADVTASMTEEQRDELNTLKHEDPDAWRVKLNEIEQSNGEAFKEKRAEISKKAAGETELEFRERALVEFSEANPEITLNDDVIANDLPPRYLKKLEAGECTFEEFLDDCKNYLTKGKVLKAEEPANDISLSKLSGGARPEESAINKEIVGSYKDELY